MSTQIIYCCKECGNKIHRETAFYGSGLCLSCGRSGKRNGRYKGKPSQKVYICINCGRKIAYTTYLYGTGRCKVCSTSGQLNPMYGRHRYGKDSPRWAGGLTKLSEGIRKLQKYAEWRKQIFERDKYTCVKCGKKSRGNIEADHIIALSKLLRKYKIKNMNQAVKCGVLWKISNGRTLCRDCHRKTGNFASKAYKN